MSVVAYDAILGALTLAQVKSSQYDAGAEIQRARNSGSFLTQATYGRYSRPKASFDSSDLYTALNAVDPTTGLAVATGTIAIPFNARTNGGTLAGSGSATKITGANGLTVLDSISANQGDEAAMAKLTTYFRSTDGQTAPVAIAGSQTLAAQTFVNEFDLGPVTVNGTEVGGVQGVSCNFGIKVVDEGDKGAVYPMRLFIESVDPYFDITFVDFASLVTYSPLFTAMSSAVCYFRKKADGGTFVGSTTDISLTFASGIICAQSAQADGQKSGRAVLRLYGKAITKSLAATSP